MYVNQIMKNKGDGPRNQASISGELKISELVADLVEKTETYDVLDRRGNVVGEVSGDLLLFLINAEKSISLSAFLDDLEGGVAIIDRNGIVCYANRSYGRIVGIPEREMLGKSMYEIEPEALMLDVLQTGKPVIIRNRIFPTVGRRIDMQIFPLKDHEEVVGAFSIFHDITDLLKSAEETPKAVRVDNGDKQYPPRIVWRSVSFANVIDKIAAVGPTEATVLIRGESGTGKELVAKLIHQNSPRADMPFVAVNCAAIPENLIESELFGYEEGAFTGSRRGGKPGKFELAHGGTLFLDEIGDMPYAMQAKLLRALQENEIEHIGGNRSIPVDVRIVAATNQPLEELIRQKQFRKDLYFRLNVVSLKIQPLRERREDIIPLGNYYLERYNEKYGKKIGISSAAYAQLEAYDWPGNVRQLQNCIESVVIMSDTNIVDSISLPGGEREATIEVPTDTDAWMTLSGQTRFGFNEAVHNYEQKLILRVLKECEGNREEALKQLGISRRTLYRKLEGFSKKA